MKLSDLLNKATNTYKQYASVAGNPAEKAIGGLAGVLQTSINKSSPSFKDGTMDANGMPIAKPAAARQDLQGADYFKNLAQNAVKPETQQAAVGWLDRNMGGYDSSMTETPTTDTMTSTDTVGGDTTDFSTTTSNVAYSAEKMNELFGTKSPEDLFAMREKLRRDAALAKAGLLPEEEYMQYQGLPGLQGERGYTYDDTMALNSATADIFSNAASKADQAIKDSGLNKTSTGLNTSGIPSQYASIINSSSLGKTADERDVNRQDLVNAAMQGDIAFITELIGKGESALTGEERKVFDQRITNAEQLDQFINAVNSGNIKLGNIKSIQQSVLKKFGAQSPEYAMANLLSGGVSAQERNRLFGASLTGTEKEDAAQFIITSGDTTQIALDKARAMQSTMAYANDISALTKGGAKRSDITMWQSQGKLKTLNDYLIENGSSLAKKPNVNDKNLSYTERQQLKNAGLTDAQIDADLGFSKVGSGTKQAPKVVAGYDISSYATDPNHERSVATIYQRTPPFKTAADIDMVIRKVAPKSKITGNMVATAASTYGVDPKMVYAIMLQDSSLGTAGMGARNNNPGNIGQYDNLGRPVAGYQTLQGGVNAVAKWLSKKKVNTPNSNYA